MKSRYTLFLLVFLISCTTKEQESTVEQVLEEPLDLPVSPTKKDNWSIKTIQNSDQTWGYQILNQGNLYINQPYIPAVPGNQGFQSEEAASITAALVLHKLEAGFMPPSITLEELDSLEVLN